MAEEVNETPRWTVNVPNTIVWAFNPNYIEVTAPQGEDVLPYVEVTIGGNSIKAALYNGYAKIYISRLLQICFTNPKTERVKSISVHITGHAKNGELYLIDDIITTTITAVWGGINLGERAFNFGVYKYDAGHGWLTSHIQLFVNFPFNLELLVANGTTLSRRTNRTPYSQVGNTYAADQMITIPKNVILSGITDTRGRTVVYRQDLSDMNEGGTFDTSFDYTFHTPADTTVITHLHLRQEQEGYYLRWINHFGFVNYYLFVNGEKEVKTERTATIPEDLSMDGMYFGNSERVVGVKSERNVKVCAVNLDPDTLNYVRDIVSAPFIDLYIGLDKHGHEIWQPVRVADGQFLTKTLHNYLSDFEITIELPNHVTQTI